MTAKPDRVKFKSNNLNVKEFLTTHEDDSEAALGRGAVPPAVAELELTLLGAQLRPLGQLLHQTRLLAASVCQARSKALCPPANDVRVGQHLIADGPAMKQFCKFKMKFAKIYS